MPSVSIISVSLNAADTLKRCLASVRSQVFRDFEHIVVDGGSNDGTDAVLKANAHDRLAWISEPDKGIADAMNKGIARSSGRWLIFLNADDELAGPSVLESAIDETNHLPNAVCFLPVLATGGAERETTINVSLGRLWRKIPGCHQGMVFPRDAFAKIGGYDTTFSLCMDYEWLLRARNAGIPVRAGETILARYSLEGRSSSRKWEDQKKRFLEEKRAHFLHARSASERFLYRAYWQLYLPYRKLRNRFA